MGKNTCFNCALFPSNTEPSNEATKEEGRGGDNKGGRGEYLEGPGESSGSMACVANLISFPKKNTALQWCFAPLNYAQEKKQTQIHLKIKDLDMQYPQPSLRKRSTFSYAPL